MKQFLAVDIFAAGIKCDNPNCGFCDMSVKSSDYKRYVNKPCPDCGQSLMTPKNYRSFKRVRWVVRVVNVIAFPILLVRWLLGYTEQTVITNVDSRPDGSMTMTTPKPDGKVDVIHIP